jgi:Cu(I)/Ag(I) efflux system membrane fusion protein
MKFEMKKYIDLSKKEWYRIGIAVVAGLLVGWLFFHGSGNNVTEPANHHHEQAEAGAEKATIWTCSMHPQIRQDHPGKCPICGMDLIPLTDLKATESASADEIPMTEAAMKLADVQTMTVQEGYPAKEVRLLGRVKPDERNIAELTARYGGRIDKLFVNFTGQHVRKGEKLALIYSPELITAQKELLEAIQYKNTNPDLYRAARNKLKLWNLTDVQINSIEQKGTIQEDFEVLSPISGTVTKRQVALGDYVKTGASLFEVINLTDVWVMFDAYETDLPWLRNNDKVQFTVSSLPGETFRGKVTYIDPFIDAKTRVAHVRVEVHNPHLELKPEMFANGIVTSQRAENGKALLIPQTAVLWTGKRSIVYVKVPNREEPTFKMREITLGPESGDNYVVADGLKEGEEIAVNGVFQIDASAQLAGKPSMMNPKGGDSGAGSMPGMDMGGSKSTSSAKAETTEKAIDAKVPEAFKQQLTNVYKAYLKMKNAFVGKQFDKVQADAKAVQSALGKVDMEELKGDNHLAWMKQLNVMKPNIATITSTAKPDEQKAAFANFNKAFYESVKRFGLTGVTTYYQFCPMALNNKGAFWLSESSDIRNPYFGSDMLTCGETRDTIK